VTGASGEGSGSVRCMVARTILPISPPMIVTVAANATTAPILREWP
jgi:hypothetical protein